MGRKNNLILIFLLSISIVYGQTVMVADEASIYCDNQGYASAIVYDTSYEKEYIAYCVFSDGTFCEQWEYYRDECTYAHITPELEEGCIPEEQDCGVDYDPVKSIDGVDYFNKCYLEKQCIKQEIIVEDVEEDEFNLKSESSVEFDITNHEIQAGDKIISYNIGDVLLLPAIGVYEIEAYAEEDAVVLLFDGIMVPVYSDFEIKNNRLSLGARQVKLLPAELNAKIVMNDLNIKDFELRIVDGKSAYDLETREYFDFLWFITKTIQTHYIISAEDGSLIKKEAPFFAFFGKQYDLNIEVLENEENI